MARRTTTATPVFSTQFPHPSAGTTRSTTPTTVIRRHGISVRHQGKGLPTFRVPARHAYLRTRTETDALFVRVPLSLSFLGGDGNGGESGCGDVWHCIKPANKRTAFRSPISQKRTLLPLLFLLTSGRRKNMPLSLNHPSNGTAAQK